MAEWISGFLDRALDALLAGLVVVMVAVVAVEVVCRYVFNAPLMGAEDLAKLCMIWIVFLAAGRVARDDQHIRIDFFVDRLAERPRRIVNAAVSVIAVLVLLVTLWFGLVLLGSQRGMKSVGLNIDVTWFSSALPVGLALWSVQAIRRLRPTPARRAPAAASTLAGAPHD